MNALKSTEARPPAGRDPSSGLDAVVQLAQSATGLRIAAFLPGMENGTQPPADVARFPILANGEPVGWLSLLDLTDLTAAQRESLTQAARLAGSLIANGAVYEGPRTADTARAFFHLSADLFCIASLDGYFLHVNPAFHRVLGWSEGELLSLPFLDLVHPEDRSATLGALDTLETGRTIFEFENRYRCKNGEYRWLCWSTQPASNGLLYAVARDVTALKQFSDRIRTIFESTTDAVYTLDEEWRFTFLNGHAQSIVGAEGNVLGRAIWEVFPDVVGTELEAEFRAAMEHQTPRGFLRFVPRLSRWFEFHAYPSPRQLTVYFRDISERHRQAAEIAESRRRLLETQRIARLGDWSFNLTTGVIEIPGHTQALFGFHLNSGDRITRAIEMLAPSDRVHTRALLRRIRITGESADFVARLNAANGGRVIHCRGELVRDASGNPLRYAGTIQDITERELALQALRASQERFRKVFESSATGILIADNTGILVEVNRAACRLLGYAEAELVGVNFWDITHPDHLEECRDLVQKLVSGQIPHFVLEKKFLAKDGTGKWVRNSVSLHRDESGGVAGLAAVVEDIGDRKRAEEALAQTEDQLRQIQKMEAIGTLAGGIAHDFNNLLTVINGYSSLLLGTMADGDPLRPQLESIAEAGERATSLTRQLLSFSRRQMIQPTVLRIDSVISGMEHMLRRLIPEHIRVNVVSESALWCVRADPSQIEQVVLNLSVNARDAMPQGGELTIGTSNVVLDEAYAAAHLGATAGEYVLLTVADTGIGMDARTVGRAFEPFFTTKPKGVGTGLGLATVYGIVKQTNGHIAIDSAPGSGTRIHCYLPRVQQLTEPSAAESATVAPDEPGGGTILVVEDDHAIGRLATELLTKRGYRVLCASSGDQALALSKDFIGRIDLLLTDLVMPGISGRQLAGELRNDRPETRVLYMSGYTEDAVIRGEVGNRDVDFVAKPFDPDALIAKVQGILQRRA